MNTDQLKRLFEQRLKPKLAPLEDLRLATSKKKNALALSVGAFFITVFTGIDSALLLIVLFAIMMYCAVAFKLSWDKYRARYKKQIMSSLLNEINPSLRWHKDKFITQEWFEKSGLYDKKIDSYRGEDLIYGEIEGFQVEISELYVSQIFLAEQGGSKRKPIFEGLFLKAQCDIPFSHCSYILPKESSKQNIKQKLFGHLFKTHFGQKVVLPENEFSQSFTVISSAPDAILQTLTPELMMKLVGYRKQKQSISLSLSFVDQNLYIAIPESRDWFEPNLNAAVTDFDVVEALFQDLIFFTGLLQELGIKPNCND